MHTVGPLFFFIFRKNHDFWTNWPNTKSKWSLKFLQHLISWSVAYRLPAFKRECIQYRPLIFLYLWQKSWFLFFWTNWPKMNQNEVSYRGNSWFHYQWHNMQSVSIGCKLLKENACSRSLLFLYFGQKSYFLDKLTKKWPKIKFQVKKLREHPISYIISGINAVSIK